MKIYSRIKNEVKGILPKKLYNNLKKVKSTITPLQQGSPVCQFYLISEHLDSVVEINNFYSLFKPKLNHKAYATVTFYDSEGQLLFVLDLTLEPMGSCFISISNEFKKRKIDNNNGIVTVQLTPSNKFHNEYKTLGQLTSHFFLLYKHYNNSIGQVHPNSIYSKENKPTTNTFVSNQIVCTEDLSHFELLQMNPSYYKHCIEYTIRSLEDKNIIKSSRATLNPRQTNIFKFNTENINSKYVTIEANSLPFDNAKPLIKRNFKDGTFSISHA